MQRARIGRHGIRVQGIFRRQRRVKHDGKQRRRPRRADASVGHRRARGLVNDIHEQGRSEKGHDRHGRVRPGDTEPAGRRGAIACNVRPTALADRGGTAA